MLAMRVIELFAKLAGNMILLAPVKIIVVGSVTFVVCSAVADMVAMRVIKPFAKLEGNMIVWAAL